MPDRDLILVLGCGRSGTSALTRVLSLCGCALPSSVFAPSDMNPRGFWESADATKLNVEFLIKHKTMVTDPCMGLEASVRDDDKQDLIEKIRAFLKACPGSPMLVVKCAGVLELFEYWLDAAQREGFAVKVVIVVRHPNEVLASFNSSGTTSTELTAVFWLTRNLLAERYSRDLPRVVVSYANLINNWRTEVARVSAALAIDLKPDENAIDGFLTRALYRNRCSDSINDVFAYSWTSRVYRLLSVAAEDGAMDVEQMDEIYDAYKTNERTFRIARNEHEKRPYDLGSSLKALDDVPVWIAGQDF